MSRIAQFCDILALIRKQPRTVRELAKITGRARHRVLVTLQYLHAEGHLYIAGHTTNRHGPDSPVYAWNPSLFEREDTPDTTIREPVEVIDSSTSA